MIAQGRVAALTSARWVDLAVTAFVAVVTEVLAWTDGFLGEHIAGPRPLTAALPLLLALPMLWRRTRPLLAWSLVASGIALQALVSGDSAEGLEVVAALIAGPYAVAAYAPRRRAYLGLGILIGSYAVYAWNDQNFRSGRSSDEWATAFFAIAALASWLIGSVVHARREEVVAAERARVLDEQARAAVADERGRVARELHDIVSHNLSVVVLQAAGARAASEHTDFDASETLERIEQSGREALVEMRRMLGVLRTGGADADLAPQPGLREIPRLIDSVRETGLLIDSERVETPEVPPVVGLCAYRIVQEALTNVLKHAGACRVHIVVAHDAAALTVVVRDDGAGPKVAATTNGHGLVGMRERVALLGGELSAAACAGGGFEIRARLPLQRTPS